MKTILKIGSLMGMLAFGLTTAFGQGAVAAPAGAPKLKIGDKAPAMKVAQWVKGNKVEKFETGKVYVVEFWATWCGPCIESIPHISEMAKKYKGKATFTGISVWENPYNLETIRKFVKKMGDKMDYNVGADDGTNVMATTWMTAAAQDGIPSAFVINQEGRIAWIGHPMDGMDQVLDKVISKKLDIDAEAAKQADAKRQEDEMKELMKPFVAAMQKGDIKGGLAELDKIFAKKPAMEKDLGVTKFELMLTVDEPAAYDYARKLSTGIYKDEANALNTIAWTIVDDQTEINNPDYELSISLAQMAVDKAKKEDILYVYALDTLAYGYFKSGKIDKAIEIQEKAVNGLPAYGDKIPATTQKEIKDRLAMFKAKKKGA